MIDVGADLPVAAEQAPPLVRQTAVSDEQQQGILQMIGAGEESDEDTDKAAVANSPHDSESGKDVEVATELLKTVRANLVEEYTRLIAFSKSDRQYGCNDKKTMRMICRVFSRKPTPSRNGSRTEITAR